MKWRKKSGGKNADKVKNVYYFCSIQRSAYKKTKLNEGGKKKHLNAMNKCQMHQ